MKEIASLSVITGTYDDCKKKLVVPRTFMCSQNFTMAEKSKRMASNPGVKKSPGAHRKDRKKRTESQATFMTTLTTGAIPEAATLFRRAKENTIRLVRRLHATLSVHYKKKKIV
jgi:hypothetical protein